MASGVLIFDHGIDNKGVHVLHNSSPVPSCIPHALCLYSFVFQSQISSTKSTNRCQRRDRFGTDEAARRGLRMPRLPWIEGCGPWCECGRRGEEIFGGEGRWIRRATDDCECCFFIAYAGEVFCAGRTLDDTVQASLSRFVVMHEAVCATCTQI